MKILITGARGMVAHAAADHCRSIGDEVIAASREELDISDRESVRTFMHDRRPDAVLNCAAYTNVDGAETDGDGAFRANALGVENLARSAREVNCGFLTISTDYVFDGATTGFYTQRDTPLPISAYGRSKRAGEMLAMNHYGRSIIVRSGWIYGEGGTNFLSVLKDILAAGKPVTAIADAYGTPTFAGDLARRMRQLVDLDLPCIFHVTNAGPGTSYFGFAEKLCELGGFGGDLLTPVSNDLLNRPAPRPQSSKLACIFSERFGLEPMPHWTDALARFVHGTSGN